MSQAEVYQLAREVFLRLVAPHNQPAWSRTPAPDYEQLARESFAAARAFYAVGGEECSTNHSNHRDLPLV